MPNILQYLGYSSYILYLVFLGPNSAKPMIVYYILRLFLNGYILFSISFSVGVANLVVPYGFWSELRSLAVAEDREDDYGSRCGG